MGGALGSCVGSSEGFPEVWTLGPLLSLPWVGGCTEEEMADWVSSGLRSGPLSLPFPPSSSPHCGPSLDPRAQLSVEGGSEDAAGEGSWLQGLQP